MKPVNNLVLVTPIELPSQSAGGIIYPDNSKTKTNKGKVVDVAPSVDVCSKGDTIIFNQYAPIEIEIDKATFWFVKENDILGVL